MRHSVKKFGAIAALVVSVSLLPALALAGEPFNCNACHKSLSRGSVPHKPVAEKTCMKCHQQFSDNHPLGAGSMGFIVPKEKLCAVCHGGVVQKPFLHGPVGKGDCTACHLAHAADNDSLLKDPSPALCYRCHPQERYTGIHTHAPVAKGDCLACHDAHQSEGRGLLKKPGTQFCFLCHDPKLGMGQSLHKPVATGECVLCHAPHGSPYRKILKAEYPTELYRPFDTDAFPLCFSCHDPELAAAATTDSATKFRNGDRNLHAVHVNKAGKGRSCKMCHDPHATSQDRLIYPKAAGFGTWDIPIRFTSTETGGGCSVGCHRTYRYDRVKAVEQ